MMAGYSGITLSRQMASMPFWQRQITLSMSAIALGGGVWSMHFIAMLAMELPFDFFYDSLITLISSFVAILANAVALLLTVDRPNSQHRRLIAGVVFGLGVAAMHYIGMAGLQGAVPMYSTFGLLVSAFSAITLGPLAIEWAFNPKRGFRIAALVFAIAVSGVHYSAMFGTHFDPHDLTDGVGPTISNQAMTFGVTVCSFIIAAAFLLTGSWFETLERRRNASQEPANLSSAPAAHTEDIRLPFERGGKTHLLPLDEIYAVQAEGHYSKLFGENESFFCPLSVSEIENRTQGHSLQRVHRSFLVNFAYVESFERKKNIGTCYLQQPCTIAEVPVGRTRLADTIDRLALHERRQVVARAK